MFDMSILQKAYNKIKGKIEFAFFKRKFNAWYEKTDIDIIEDINYYKTLILDNLADDLIDTAFNHYKCMQKSLHEKEQLESFKKYILDNENNEH